MTPAERIGIGLAVIGVGVTLFMGLPPPWWPDMPRILINGGVLFGIVLILVGACFILISTWSAIRQGRKMLPLIGMAVFGLAFLVCVAWYFWPPKNGAESKQAQKIPAPVSSISKAELRISMRGGNVFVPDGLPKPTTGIALDARIWNTGGPSVAVDWHLTVTPKSGAPVLAQLTKMPERITVSGNPGAVILGSDSLEEKTNKNPIGTTPIDGILLFYVKLDRLTVLDPKTRLDLSVTDILGTETKVSQIMGDWLKNH
jgi:energy-coupling factor transporter transmembrane protein EcfT